MTTQVNLRMNNKLFNGAKSYAEEFGYENVQDFIRELVREKVFEEENLTLKEIEYAKKIEKISDEKNLYGSIEDIRNILKTKKNVSK